MPELRKLIAKAQEDRRSGRGRTIVFIDEIHRFNKAQQDVLLPYVENGTIVLIGATTENPFFEINSPLLSRMKVVRLENCRHRRFSRFWSVRLPTRSVVLATALRRSLRR